MNTQGQSKRYLIRERLFRLGDHSEITDESGRPVLQVDGKVLSLRNRLILRDPNGQEVAQVHRKLAALRPTYRISIDQLRVGAGEPGRAGCLGGERTEAGWSSATSANASL
jgi:uncharacterized protein YxjI